MCGAGGGRARWASFPQNPLTPASDQDGAQRGPQEAGQGPGARVAARPGPSAGRPSVSPCYAPYVLTVPGLTAAWPLTFRQSRGCVSTSGYCTCGGGRGAALRSGPRHLRPPHPRRAGTHPAVRRPARVLQVVAEGPWPRAPAQAHVAPHGTCGLPAQCPVPRVVSDSIPQGLRLCRDPPLSAEPPPTCLSQGLCGASRGRAQSGHPSSAPAPPAAPLRNPASSA